MKTQTGCIPCIMMQAFNTARRATNDPHVQREILSLAADHVKTLSLDQSPADASNYVYHVTTQITDVLDPYKDDKIAYNDLCMELLPALRQRIDAFPDPLHAAMKAAIMGNIIDLGIAHSFNVEQEVATFFEKPLAIDDYPELKKILESGRKKILYLGDNAGEIVFDRLFIEKLSRNHDVNFSVKSGPIINDATRSDAHDTGIDRLAHIIETGSNGIGVYWGGVSEEFRQACESADVIISKGQGNFETMEHREEDIFFLLRAKCEFVAAALGVKFGEVVCKRGKR